MNNPYTLPRTEAAKLLALLTDLEANWAVAPSIRARVRALCGLLTDLEANWAVANPPALPTGVTTGTPSNIPTESHTGTNPRRDWAR